MHPHVAVWQWATLVAVIVALLIVDLLVAQRRPHVPSLREAVIESAGWIAASLAFGLVVWHWFGATVAGQYYAGYLLEKSLSVDNVFVWSLILTRFAVPAAYRFRVLFWGVFGALVMRAVCIAVGVRLLERFEVVLYLLGALLVVTSVRMLTGHASSRDPSDGRMARLVRRVVPTSDAYDGPHLFTRQGGRRLATPLFTVVVLVEVTDLVFATDSIPAVLAVSRNAFVAFSSNAFAVCGLRALYFCLEGARARLGRLDEGVAVILLFVGLKMLLAHVVSISTGVSLGVIAALLAGSVVWSLADTAD